MTFVKDRLDSCPQKAYAPRFPLLYREKRLGTLTVGWDQNLMKIEMITESG